MGEWLYFLFSAAGVIAAGVYIGRISGALGDRLGLGRAWAGVVLLSLATTLPELVSTTTVIMRGDIGMGFGGILGSVTFNLTILVLIDFFSPQAMYPAISRDHLFTGVLSCVMLAVLGLFLGLSLIPDRTFVDVVQVGHVGVGALALIFIYALGQYVFFQLSKREPALGSEETSPSFFSRLSVLKLVGLYLGIALVIIFSAYHLGIAAETLAKKYHLASTFAGAILLGVVTSLPELTNAITSSRRNEADLAVGNVLGANAFVLVVLAIADFFYLPQSIFLAIPESDALSSMIVAFLAIIMQGFFLGALAGKSRHQVWKLGTVSLFILGLYIFSIFILQRFSEAM